MGTRNQVKRAHKLTMKHVDVSSRFYIRLMLELLRHGQFTGSNQSSKQEQSKQIEAIYGYIKSIFTQKKNICNILPFVLLCVVYSYCTVNDDILQKFVQQKKKNKKNDENENEDSDNEPIIKSANNNKQKNEQKLKRKIKEYERETIVFKNVLTKMLSKEWEFVMEQ